MQRIQCVFHGRVQGVGFRYTVVSLAQQYAVTGVVKNRMDGGVTMEVQGAAREVKRFIDALLADPPGRVEKVARQEVPVIAGETGFRIRY